MSEPAPEIECPFCFTLHSEEEAEPGYCRDCGWPLDQGAGFDAAKADHAHDLSKDQTDERA